MIKAYVDSGVLIEAYRGAGPLAAPALAILSDPGRTFLTSDFVRLEVLPKPMFYNRSSEVEFYTVFFAATQRSVPITKALVNSAMQRAAVFGLSAVDALHVAAAEIARADELVTAERPAAPLSRVTSLRVVSIRP